MNNRRMTLHQLVYMSVKEALNSEGLIRSELHELTDYILNHSTAQITASSLSLTEGNLLGVSGDREITVPRFLTFDFTKRSAFDISEGTGRTWKLRSYATFDELQSYVSYATNYPTVLIDGSIVSYEVEPKLGYGYEVVWGFDTYILTYVAEDTEHKEFIRSEIKLQNRILQLVEQNAEDLMAYNIIEGRRIDFDINKRIYTTRANAVCEVNLVWCNDLEEEDEEMMF